MESKRLDELESCHLICGIADIDVPVAGMDVKTIRSACVHLLTIPEQAQALVNGVLVDDGRPLAEGDVLEFVAMRGRKGMNFGRDVLDLIHERLTSIEDRLGRIEATIEMVSKHQVVQAAYSTEQFAQLVGRAEYTVREWCRLGRIAGGKRPSGRGYSLDWSISHEELERYRNFGLRPLRKN